MSTEPVNRQPQGIPAGGQFAATTHAEAPISLTQPRRQELEGWPESLPDPEVSVHMGDDNVITTFVAIDGESVFEVWNPGDDVHSAESSTFEHPAVADEDIHDAAEAWARNKHNEIARDFRTEMHSAFERSKARILAKATGVPTEMSDKELGNLVTMSQSAQHAGRRDAELAATAVIARTVLKGHPDARHISLKVDSADNGEYVSGAVIYDAAGKNLGSLSRYESLLEPGEVFPGDEVADMFSALDTNPETSWWGAHNLPHSETDDPFTIDLAKAAAWTPGAKV